MKNKKIIYAIIGIVILISMVVIIAIISNKPMPIEYTPKEATSIIEELKKKFENLKYGTFTYNCLRDLVNDVYDEKINCGARDNLS